LWCGLVNKEIRVACFFRVTHGSGAASLVAAETATFPPLDFCRSSADEAVPLTLPPPPCTLEAPLPVCTLPPIPPPPPWVDVANAPPRAEDGGDVGVVLDVVLVGARSGQRSVAVRIDCADRSRPPLGPPHKPPSPSPPPLLRLPEAGAKPQEPSLSPPSPPPPPSAPPMAAPEALISAARRRMASSADTATSPCATHA